MSDEQPSPSPPHAEALNELLQLMRDGERIARLLQSVAPSPPSTPPTLAGDILYGADAVAEFLFGDRKHRRKVYNLVETNGLPHFRIGASICVRKSVLLIWISDQEGDSFLAGYSSVSAGSMSNQDV